MSSPTNELVTLLSSHELDEQGAALLRGLAADGTDEERDLATRRLRGYRVERREVLADLQLETAEQAWDAGWWWVAADRDRPARIADYDVEAAPPDAWRDFDPEQPEPGYYQFDALSSRHPDLYHRFALSTVGAMDELQKLVDLRGRVVADVGAGTGRATLAAARVAAKVYAIDAYASVLDFNARVIADAGLDNVEHARGDRNALPLDDGSVDVVLWAMATPGLREAARVLRPGGIAVQIALQPPWLSGELTQALWGIDAGPIDVDAVPVDRVRAEAEWDGAPVTGGINEHDFPYVATYDSAAEAAAIYGRLMGPAAAAYLISRDQRTVAWAMRITWARRGDIEQGRPQE